MKVHADAAAPERHPFQLEPQALLAPLFPKESDPSAGSHDPMPWDSLASLQRPDGETSGP
jgi:hypothetical protein